MNLFRPRPRYTVDVPAAPEAVVDALRTALTHGGTGCEGAVASRHIVLRVPLGQRRYFSPVLDANVVATEAGTRLSGTFGPHPSVWTLFVFIRSFLLFATTATTVFACSQSMVHGASPWWKWAAVAGVLVVVEYLAAQVGQRLGNDQIELLEHFVEEAVGPLGYESTAAVAGSDRTQAPPDVVPVTAVAGGEADTAPNGTDTDAADA